MNDAIIPLFNLTKTYLCREVSVIDDGKQTSYGIYLVGHFEVNVTLHRVVQHKVSLQSTRVTEQLRTRKAHLRQQID